MNHRRRSLLLAILAVGASGFVSPPQETARTRRRRELEALCAATSGWTLRETAHYFVTVQTGSAKFADEVAARCEGVRTAVREVFSHPDGDPTPIERAPSLVRVFKDRGTYLGFGGPADALSYWDGAARELVLFDDADGGGRRNTWAGLNTTVYFEYMETTFGADVPTWFLRGHASYFEPFEHRDGKCAPAIGSTPELPAERPSSTFEMLARFVKGGGRFSDSEFQQLGYGPLGWSLVWTLRRDAREEDERPTEWKGALDRWWSSWLGHRDGARANRDAFAGFDWKALDAACELTLRERPVRPFRWSIRFGGRR